MVCKFAYEIYGNGWCPVGKIYCTGGNECGFNHNHQTNADRIRAMSDEELAHFMIDRSVNESTLLLMDKDNGLTAVQIEALRHRLYCAYKQWLKQPAEVTDNA